MVDDPQYSALERKAGSGRKEAEIPGMSVPKALRMALSKAAQDEYALPLTVLGVKEQRLALHPLMEILDDEALLMVLDGGIDHQGVAMFDGQLLAGLIEVQTTGRVIHGEAPPRKPTQTDSAMCEVFLNRTLREFGQNLDGLSAAKWGSGFEFSARIKNTRLLALLLEDIAYRVFRITVDMFEGAKQGELILVMPAQGKHQGPAAGKSNDNAPQKWTQTLTNAVHGSEVQITGVLHRMQVSLATVSAYQVGDMIPIPQSCLMAVSMEGLDGRQVMTARLGQQNGYRALRIVDTAEDSEMSGGMGTQAEEAVMHTDSPAAPMGEGAGMGGPMEMADLNAAPAFPDVMGGLDAEGMAPLGELPALAGLAPLDGAAPVLPMSDDGSLAPMAPMAPMGDLPPLDMALPEADDALATPMAMAPMEMAIG